MKNLFLLVLTLFAILPSLNAQLDSLKLAEYVELLGDNDKFMGSVAVMQDSKVLFAKSVGDADVETGKQITIDTKFRIGSISKTFTSTMVLLAVEEGKLKLEDKLSNYYPKIINSEKISLEQMLYHRTGIHSFTDDEEYMNWNTEFRTNDQLLEMITNYKSDFEPDSKFEYSNSNFVLLSLILQDVYGKSYAELLTEKIVQPLGLKNTYYGGKININNNECNSYAYEGKWNKVSETDMSIPIGAGAVVSTVLDLMNFIDALLNEKIISKASITRMTTYRNGFGLGIFEMTFEELNGAGHTGGIDGFTSLLVYFPENKMAIALTSNGTNYRNNEIVKTIVKNVKGEEVILPVFSTYEVNEKDLKKYLGTYKTDALPLDLTITQQGNVLKAQATGQPELVLTPTGKDIFSFDLAGIVIEFYPKDNKLILKQGGGEFTFIRDKK